MAKTDQSVTTSDALIKRLSENRQQRLRKNIQILFLNLSSEETDPIISLLRGARLAPRGRQISSEEEFLEALSERSWDMVVCADLRGTFSPKQAIHHIKRLDKDIPVIQLIPSADSSTLLQGLRANMQAVVPVDQKELLMIFLRRELDQLEKRRQLRHTEAMLHETEKRCQQLMESSSLAIAFCNEERILFANQALTTLFGHEHQSTMENQLTDRLLVQGDREEFREQVKSFIHEGRREVMLQLTGSRVDDTQFNANIELQNAFYNEIPCVQMIIRPEKQFLERKLFAQQDLITGLANRDALQKKLDSVMELALDGGHDCNLLYISLDHYQSIRSEIGFDGADQVARDVADVLVNTINPAHFISRPHDDVFVVIYFDPSPDKSVLMAEKICNAIASIQSKVNGTTIQTTASIGITSINDNAPKQDELINRAQVAAASVQSSKSSGNGVMMHIPEDENADNAATEALRTAIEQEHFRLLFQPIVPLSQTTNQNHYEVLLRLLDEEEHEVSPNVFMTTVDDAQISTQIDRWVITESLKLLKTEYEKGHKNRLFINLSGRTLADPEILPWFAKQLRQSRLPADNIVFQFSETDISSQLQKARNFVDALKQIHCKSCIKHFGTSTNSMSVLHQISADYIKIDGSYIQDLATTDAESFIKLVEELKNMHKITIAPLVEGTKVMGTLWKCGVGFIQGFYLQPPKEKMDYDFFEG